MSALASWLERAASRVAVQRDYGAPGLEATAQMVVDPDAFIASLAQVVVCVCGGGCTAHTQPLECERVHVCGVCVIICGSVPGCMYVRALDMLCDV